MLQPLLSVYTRPLATAAAVWWCSRRLPMRAAQPRCLLLSQPSRLQLLRGLGIGDSVTAVVWLWWLCLDGEGCRRILRITRPIGLRPGSTLTLLQGPCAGDVGGKVTTRYVVWWLAECCSAAAAPTAQLRGRLRFQQHL